MWNVALFHKQVFYIYDVDIAYVFMNWLLLFQMYFVYSFFAPFCNVTIILWSASYNWHWIKITLLSLQAQTHVKVVGIIFLIVDDGYSIWSNYVLEPRMTQQFWERYTIVWLDDKHFLYQVFGFSANINSILNIHLHLTLVKTLHGLSSERYSSLKHDI